MDNTEKILPKFLSDKPSNNNSFGNNTTFTINKSILSKIINDNTKNDNKIIALTGKWGAGKNTVIEMLKDDENIEVVEFDTLSLYNEQIRRNFLFNLYHKLKINKEDIISIHLDKEKSDLENYICGNVKKSYFKSNIEFLNTTKILIIIAFIFITSISIYNIFNIFENQFFNKYSILFTLLAIALIIVFIFISLVFWDKKIFSLKDIILTIFPFTNIPTDLLQSSTEETENNDITSDDFKNYYYTIIESYNKKTEDKNNIALVIDNLDRIDSNKAMDIIYNLHLFMSDDKKYDNIYFIVLIDKDKFFDKSNDKNDSDFFEKIFPIRLEISGIVNLNWRKFFEDKIEEAFKEFKLSKDIKMQSISLYEEFSLSNIVPRDIIYFINKVVYNSIVLIEGNIETDKDKNFKASILNACYSMFVEERKKVKITEEENSKYKYNIQKFVSKIKGDDVDNLKNINSLLSEYDKEWEKLLYQSYFQTYKPYDALYLADLEHYMKNFTEEKISNLKNDIDDDNIFNELLKTAMNKLDNNLEIKYWINITNTIIDYSDKSDSFIHIIFKKYNYKDNIIEGIGKILAKIYNASPKKESIISDINKILNKSLNENNILDIEYINCYDYINKNEKDKFLENIKFKPSKEFPRILIDKYKKNVLCKKILDANNFTFYKENIDNIITNITNFIKENTSNSNSIDYNNIIKDLNLFFLYIFYDKAENNDVITNFFSNINGNFYKNDCSSLYSVLLDICFYIANNNSSLYEKIKNSMNNILKYIYLLKNDYYNYIYSTILLLKLDLLNEPYQFNEDLFNKYIDKYKDLQNNNIKIQKLMEGINNSKNNSFQSLRNDFYKFAIENIEKLFGIENKIIPFLKVNEINKFSTNNKFADFIDFIHKKDIDYLEKYIEIVNEDVLLNIAEIINIKNHKEFNFILNRFKSINKGKESELFKKAPSRLFEILINNQNNRCNFPNYEFELIIKDTINSLNTSTDASLIKEYIDKIEIIFSKDAIKDINDKLLYIDLSFQIDASNIDTLISILKTLNNQKLNISKILEYCIYDINNSIIDAKYTELFKFFNNLIENKNNIYINLFISNKDIFRNKLKQEELDNDVKIIIDKIVAL